MAEREGDYAKVAEKSLFQNRRKERNKTVHPKAQDDARVKAMIKGGSTLKILPMS